MKLDEVIIKYFEELNAKASELEQTVVVDREDGYREALDETKFFEWSTSVMSLFERIFEKDCSQIKFFHALFEKGSNCWSTQVDCFRRCYGVFISAYNDYKNGYLFKIKSLVNAEVLDNVIEQSEELFKAKYKDASCIIAGVALETTLRKLCADEKLTIGKLDKMNADLAKAGKYNILKQKQITAWADIRNKAAHGKWEEYTDIDVKQMMDGVRNFIADYL